MYSARCSSFLINTILFDVTSCNLQKSKGSYGRFTLLILLIINFSYQRSKIILFVTKTDLCTYKNTTLTLTNSKFFVLRVITKVGSFFDPLPSAVQVYSWFDIVIEFSKDFVPLQNISDVNMPQSLSLIMGLKFWQPFIQTLNFLTGN